MTRILAIDPGSVESGWCIIDADTRRPMRFGKTDNRGLRDLIRAAAFDDADHTAIEMVASYGMAVGKDVFETCVWIGRFQELITLRHRGSVDLVYRLQIKNHHCHSIRATDTNIRQALVDRYASGVRNHGKGSKAEPGWFYGFHSDVWSAYALAVYIADTQIAVAPLPYQRATHT